MEEIKCEQVGMLSGGKWDKLHDISRRVYSVEGLAPTVHTDGSGQQELKIVEPRIAAMRGRNPDNPSDRTAGSPTEQRLEIGSVETSNTITTVQKDNLVIEPAILTPKRTEYGKAIRKDYEAGKIQESRHNMTELEPRMDGVSNTLTTVQKDNLVVEPTIWGSLQKNCAKKKDGICPTLTSAMGDGGGQIPMHNYDYRIRKLTERECFRLMGVKEEDFDRVAENQSTSSLYHLAGDSIVTACLMAILGQLFGIDYQAKINELVEDLKQ